MTERWRVGRKLGRTIYLQAGSEPSDDDVLIGVMDTTELAQQVVDAVNAATAQRILTEINKDPAEVERLARARADAREGKLYRRA